jgi:hypothetical protein
MLLHFCRCHCHFLGEKWGDEIFIYLLFSNAILLIFVIDTDCEKQLISPLGFVKFFRPPHC